MTESGFFQRLLEHTVFVSRSSEADHDDATCTDRR